MGSAAASLKRRANDDIADRARALGYAGDETVPFVCECEAPCLEVRRSSLDDYDAARAAGEPLAVRGH